MKKITFKDFILDEQITMDISDISEVTEDNGIVYIKNTDGLCFITEIVSYQYL